MENWKWKAWISFQENLKAGISMLKAWPATSLPIPWITAILVFHSLIEGHDDHSG